MTRSTCAASRRLWLFYLLLAVVGISETALSRVDDANKQAPASVAPMSATPSLIVTVYDAETGDTVKSATVSIDTGESILTNKNGQCTFAVLSATDHVIDVTKTGYYLIRKPTTSIDTEYTTRISIQLPLVLSIVADATQFYAETGALYSQPVSAKGGEPPYQYSVSGGALPAGMVLDGSSGVISGVPSEAGVYNFTIQASDFHSSVEESFIITQVNPLVFTDDLRFPDGTVGEYYLSKITVIEGKPDYWFSVSSGALPDGLKLSASGIISGTPTTRISKSFIVQVRDVRDATEEQEFIITIFDQISITNNRFKNGKTGSSYNQSLSHIGGNDFESVSWSVQSGELPPGLSVRQSDSLAWVISGVPSKAVSTIATLKVTDFDGRSSTKRFTFYVTDLDLALATKYVFNGHDGPVGLVKFSPDGRKAITSGLNDQTLFLWNLDTGKQIYKIERTNKILGAALSIDGQQLLTGDSSGLLSQWNAETGNYLQSFSGGHTEQVVDLMLTKDDKWMLSGSEDNTAILWDPQIWNKQLAWFVYKKYIGHSDNISAAVFSPDETKILTGSHDKTAILWDKASSSQIATFAGHGGPVNAVDFSPSGSMIVTAAGEPDNTAKLWTWSGSTAINLGRYDFHSGAINAAAFSPNENQVLTGSDDHSLILWDADELSTILSFDQPMAPTYSVAFSPDGQYCLSGHDDVSILRWLGPSLKVEVKNLTAGTPVSGATVTIAGLTRLTDSAGQCSFRYIPNGDYEIQVSKSGLQMLNQTTVNIVQFQTMQLEIDLIPNSDNPLNIFTTSLPRAETGRYYDQQIVVGGGRAPYKFTIPYGTLPPGLSLQSANGIISGTPTVEGSYKFNISVLDSDFIYVEQEFIINQDNPVTIITPERLKNGTVGISYPFSFELFGGLAPFNFAVVSSSLPGGLTMSTDGKISGSPTAAGVFSFKVKVTDARNETHQKEFDLDIFNPITIDMIRLNDGVVGHGFKQQLTISGGNPNGPYVWDYNSGRDIPGVDLIQEASQSWVLSGTPTEDFFETLVFAVKDQDGRSAIKDYLLEIYPPIEITTDYLPDGRRDEAYSEVIEFESGAPPFSFTASGQLPAGLSLNKLTGVISGIPTISQLKTFTVKVTDSAYPDKQSVEKSLTIRIVSDMVILTPSLLAGVVRDVTLTPIILSVSGGTPPYSWSLVDGTLPDGTEISSASGEIRGIPAEYGDFDFTLRVNDADGATADKRFSWRVFDTLKILSDAVPNAAKESDYYFRISLSGGEPPFLWQIKSGALPGGLQLAKDTGALFGRPIENASVEFTVQVSDGIESAQTVEKTYSIMVDDNIFPPDRRLPDGVIDIPYNVTFYTEVGIAPYVWRIASGALPEGISFEGSIGNNSSIAGTPIQPGSYSFQLSFTDSSIPVINQSRDYELKIITPIPTPTPTYTSTPTLTPTPTATPTPTITFTPTITSTPTITPTFTMTSTPDPNDTPTPGPSPTNTPFYTPTPGVAPNSVNVYDDDLSQISLTGQTDFDDLDDRILSIRWNYSGSEPVYEWHVYVKQGDGGYFFIGKTSQGASRSFLWRQANVNAQYQFRVWGLYKRENDSTGLIVLTQPGPMGYNLSDGSAIKLKRIANPDDIPARTARVFDDLYHGTNLSGSQDTDSYLERALAIKWNPGQGQISNSHVYISTDGRNYSFLGQTGASDVYYYRFDGNGTFSTANIWRDGPQANTTYWFRVLAIKTTGEVVQMDTGPVGFSLKVENTPTPNVPDKPTPLPDAEITIDIAGLPGGSKSLQLVPIQSGVFLMGSPDNEEQREDDEGPQHHVTISRSFYLGKYEITNAQFAAFLTVKGAKSEEEFDYLNEDSEDNRFSLNGDQWIVDAGYENMPVVNVTWYGARDFCSWINEIDGVLNYSLPTEAQWEYACRAGSSTRYYWGDDLTESVINDYAWYNANAGDNVNQVGLKKPNAWGLYDMSGNAWEWCGDLFGEYQSSSQVDPVGADSGIVRVGRGGGYKSKASGARSARRSWDLPEFSMGFRLAGALKD